MPFVETENGDVWVSERRAAEVQDPLRRAAEQLADAVETYLFDSSHPHFHDEGVLSWYVAAYDANKTGSGNYANMHPDYDAWEASKENPRNSVKPATNPDIAVRHSDDAKRSKHVNTEAKS
jgi:hypothetical protein